MGCMWSKHPKYVGNDGDNGTENNGRDNNNDGYDNDGNRILLIVIIVIIAIL